MNHISLMYVAIGIVWIDVAELWDDFCDLRERLFFIKPLERQDDGGRVGECIQSVL